MSEEGEIRDLTEKADSIAEFIEIANEHEFSIESQAVGLRNIIWDRDIPTNRIKRILRRERDRIDEYDRVSLSVSERAPRYMDLHDLELVSGHEFEYLLAEILSRVEGEAIVTKASGDQGVDVIWERNERTIGIQAKAYNMNNPVGNSAVQEIHTGATVMKSDYSIDVPAVVTTSRYTDSAREAAEESNVRLYGRSHLEQWLSEAELDAEAVGETLENI